MEGNMDILESCLKAAIHSDFQLSKVSLDIIITTTETLLKVLVLSKFLYRILMDELARLSWSLYSPSAWTLYVR